MKQLFKTLSLFILLSFLVLPVHADAKTKPVSLANTKYLITRTTYLDTKQVKTTNPTLKVKKTKGVKIIKKKFSTSNKKIATVTSKGKISPKKGGNVVIKVKVSYRKNKKTYSKTLSCQVKITDKTACKHSVSTTTINQKESTCEHSGYSGDTFCNSCKKVVKNGSVLQQKSHTQTTKIVNAVVATCEQEGYTGDKKCAYCGYLVQKGKTLPALGHKCDTFHPAVQATCRDFGKKSYYTCANPNCDKYLNAQAEVIDDIKLPRDPNNHYGTPVLTNQKSATCEASGYSGDKICVNCRAVIESGTVTAPLGHKIVTLKAVSPTCTKTGLTAGAKCSTCGKVTSSQNTVAALGHNFNGTTQIIKNPTYYQSATNNGKGLKRVYCSRSGCGSYTNVEIDCLVKVSKINSTWVTGGATMTNQGFTFTKVSTGSGKPFYPKVVATVPANKTPTKSGFTFKLCDNTNGTGTTYKSYLAIASSTSTKVYVKCKKLPSARKVFYLKITAADGQGACRYQKIVIDP